MTKSTVCKKQNRLQQILLSPWTILIGVCTGIYLGTYQTEWVPVVAPVGRIFINTLKMCVLPILISAIAASIARLIKTDTGKGFIGRVAALFLLTMFTVSIVGMVVGLVAKPGSNLGAAGLSVMGSHVSSSKYAPDIEINLTKIESRRQKKPTAIELVDTLIPKNVFNALSRGRNLQVLFFSIFAGIAIGFLSKASSQLLINGLEALYETFAKVVNWLRYLLPFGLCGLMAEQFSDTKIEILLAMGKFMVALLLPFLILLGFGIIILRLRSGRSLAQVLAALKDPVIIALGTGTSLPAIPSALTGMTDELGFSKDKVDLLAPLGITACRFGNMLYFSIATLFIAQLNQISITPTELIFVLVGSVLAGIATAGTSGIMTLVLLGLVLKPLGLPLDGVLPLLIVIDPIVGPLRAMTNVQLNLAVTSMLVERS